MKKIFLLFVFISFILISASSQEKKSSKTLNIQLNYKKLNECKQIEFSTDRITKPNNLSLFEKDERLKKLKVERGSVMVNSENYNMPCLKLESEDNMAVAKSDSTIKYTLLIKK